MRTFAPVNRILVLLFAVASLSDCKKNHTEESIIFPVTFYGKKVEITSNTRMFTKDGEIKDEQKIAKFIRGVTYFNIEQDQTENGTEAINFTSKDKAYFSNNDALIFDVVESGGRFLFTSEMKYVMGPSDQNNYKKHILKYQNVISQGGFASSEHREVRVANGDYKQLRIAMLAYHTSSGNAGGTFKEGGTAINEFNEGVVDYMTIADTIAVKSYHIICVAK